MQLILMSSLKNLLSRRNIFIILSENLRFLRYVYGNMPFLTLHEYIHLLEEKKNWRESERVGRERVGRERVGREKELTIS